MTLEQFVKLVFEDAEIIVFDEWGLVGTYKANELLKKFNKLTRVIEITARNENVFGISIDTYF